MRRLPILLAAMVAAPALAQDLQGAPQVSVAAEGDGAVVRAAMDVAAPPQVVFATLADCAHAADFMPKLISCKVLKRDVAGRWEVREHQLKGNVLKPVLRNVFRLELEPPGRLAFQRVAGDWKRSEGEWRITPLDGGRAARVTYETHVAMAGAVPAGMVRSAVARGMPQSMLALRREAVARAQAAKP